MIGSKEAFLTIDLGYRVPQIENIRIWAQKPTVAIEVRARPRVVEEGLPWLDGGMFRKWLMLGRIEEVKWRCERNDGGGVRSVGESMGVNGGGDSSVASSMRDLTPPGWRPC